MHPIFPPPNPKKHFLASIAFHILPLPMQLMQLMQFWPIVSLCPMYHVQFGN